MEGTDKQELKPAYVLSLHGGGDSYHYVLNQEAWDELEDQPPYNRNEYFLEEMLADDEDEERFPSFYSVKEAMDYLKENDLELSGSEEGVFY